MRYENKNASGVRGIKYDNLTPTINGTLVHSIDIDIDMKMYSFVLCLQFHEQLNV